MRKTSIMALILLLSIVTLTSMEIAASSAVLIAQIPSTSLYMKPFRIEGTAGQKVKVNATIQDVTNLFSFQIGALFDPAVAECISVTEGGFLSNNGADFLLAFPGTIDNVKGVVIPFGWTLIDVTKAKSGTGKLAIFTFNMKKSGHGYVHVYGFEGIDKDGLSMPAKTMDYYTAVLDSSDYVVKIVGNAQGVGVAGSGGYAAHFVSKVTIPIGLFVYRGQFRFNVTGFPVNGNEFAYFNVTIPKSMMWCDTRYQWVVMLNDVVQDKRLVRDNATHTIVSLEFTYAKPVQIVKILSTHIVPFAIPEVLISTDKTVYKPGNTMLVTLTVSNPTATVYPSSRLTVSIGWPTGGGITIFDSGIFTLPASFSKTLTGSLSIPNSIFVPDGTYSFTARLTYDGKEAIAITNFQIQR